MNAAWLALQYVLAFAGRTVPAMNLRGLSPALRGKIAFARLREANVDPNRLMALHLAVAALVEDDWRSDRSHEFRMVQTAKAAHRLASGTHRKWELPNPNGEAARNWTIHVYPRSAGLVLRRIGEEIEKASSCLGPDAVREVIALKAERFGPHPSRRAVAPTSAAA